MSVVPTSCGSESAKASGEPTIPPTSTGNRPLRDAVSVNLSLPRHEADCVARKLESALGASGALGVFDAGEPTSEEQQAVAVAGDACIAGSTLTEALHPVFSGDLRNLSAGEISASLRCAAPLLDGRSGTALMEFSNSRGDLVALLRTPTLGPVLTGCTKAARADTVSRRMTEGAPESDRSCVREAAVRRLDAMTTDELVAALADPNRATELATATLTDAPTCTAQ